MMTFPTEWKIKNVPNHQPGIDESCWEIFRNHAGGITNHYEQEMIKEIVEMYPAKMEYHHPHINGRIFWDHT